MVQRRLTRSEVDEAQTWNLDDLYRSQAEWEADLAAVQEKVGLVTAYRGRLGQGAGQLLGCLQALEALQVNLSRVGVYADLRIAEDAISSANQETSDRAAALYATVQAAISFVRSEVLLLPDGTVERFLAAEPLLAPYSPYLEQMLELKPYALSSETESAMAALGETLGSPYLIYNRAMNSDMQFPPITDGSGKVVEMSVSRWEEFEVSSDTEMRRKAFDSLVSGFDAYRNTLAATLATTIKRNVLEARLRGYQSAAEMFLRPERVPLQVYHNVLDIIQAEAAPHVRRYMNLRRRVLGLDTLQFCDTKAPLDPGYDPKTSYAEAADLLVQAFSVMGPEYNQIMTDALRRRWVDLADNAGKESGAFCHAAYNVHPYILMTWDGRMRGAFTLAHELGHAAHAGLSMAHQKVLYMWSSGFFIEAPSTLHELLLGRHILDRTQDTRMRRWVILQFLGTFMHNFVTHLLEGELERRLYARVEAGQPITASTLTEQKGDVLRSFYGDSVAVDDRAGLIWMRQPHYYIGLYPYSYAAGLAAACAASEAIRTEGEPAVQRWVTVLRAGATRYPMDLLALAGVDMQSPETIRKAVAFFGSLVTDLENSFADD